MIDFGEAYDTAMDAIIALNSEPLVKSVGRLLTSAIPGEVDDRLFEGVLSLAEYLEANRAYIDAAVERINGLLSGVFGCSGDCDGTCSEDLNVLIDGLYAATSA